MFEISSMIFSYKPQICKSSSNLSRLYQIEKLYKPDGVFGRSYIYPPIFINPHVSPSLDDN